MFHPPFRFPRPRPRTVPPRRPPPLRTALRLLREFPQEWVLAFRLWTRWGRPLGPAAPVLAVLALADPLLRSPLLWTPAVHLLPGDRIGPLLAAVEVVERLLALPYGLLLVALPLEVLPAAVRWWAHWAPAHRLWEGGVRIPPLVVAFLTPSPVVDLAVRLWCSLLLSPLLLPPLLRGDGPGAVPGLLLVGALPLVLFLWADRRLRRSAQPYHRELRRWLLWWPLGSTALVALVCLGWRPLIYWWLS